MAKKANSVAPTAAIPFLRKITPKTVTEELGIDLNNLQRPVKARVLYDVFGEIINLSHGHTDKGDWTKFKGVFQAVTPPDEDGVVHVFDSGAMHVPVMSDILEAAVLSAKEDDPTARVQIALRVSIVPASPGKPSMTGYEYDVQRILTQQSSNTDVIAQLRKEAASQLAALPAPGKVKKLAVDTSVATESEGVTAS